MKILATVFVYNRPVVLGHCLRTILGNTVQPDELLLIDDASDKPTQDVMASFTAPNITRIRKSVNLGATDSGQIALAHARAANPHYWFPIEADYIFKSNAFSTAIDVFENTEQGKYALGIVGYDHPIFGNPHVRNHIFPDCMKAQVGEDNVNRAAMYQTWDTGRGYWLELATNTCPTSYLNWHRIQEVAAEFHELDRLLDEAMDPQENPNYPDSGKYRRNRQIDDGMLSHAISLCWNRWALKHGIDRNRFAAWVNIRPSIANNITGGGINATCAEMATDGGSPTWAP